MNWKNRLTNYNFWISLISAVLLILRAFNFDFDIANISEIITAVLGLLVVIGIISDPTRTIAKQQTQTTQKEESLITTPIKTKDEDNFDINKIDIQMLVNKIKEDLDLSISKLDKRCEASNEFISINKGINCNEIVDNATELDDKKFSSQMEIDNKNLENLDKNQAKTQNFQENSLDFNQNISKTEENTEPTSFKIVN